jgi:hypothetical protein
MLRVCSLGLSLILVLLGAWAIPSMLKHPTETAPPAEWQERLDEHLSVAKQALAEDDGFHPVAAYVMPDGQEDLAVLVFRPEAEQRAIADVTRRARERGCRGLILVMDAWMGPPVVGRETRAGDAASHPQRKEVLLQLLFSPNGAWGRTVRYQRKGKKILFGPPSAWFPPNSPWNPWEQAQ